MTIESMTASRPWLTAGWTMLHFLWAGGALGLAAAAGRLALRRSAPEVRYGFALLCLGAMAVAPAAIALWLSGMPEHRTALDIPQAADLTPLPRPLAAMPATGPSDVPSRWPSIPFDIADPSRGRSTSAGWLEAAAAGLPFFWIAGTPATFAMLAAGLVGAERIRRGSRPVLDVELNRMARGLADALGIVRPVALGVCDRLASPILLGVVRPLILLPAAAVAGWSPDQIEMALLHELAHVRRHDNPVNLAQRLIESLLFFHPAVWWVSGWVRREREHCCDRMVVARTGRAHPYAALLAELALNGGRPGRAAVAMAENPIVSRIRCILNPEDHLMPLSRPAYALAAAMLIAPAALIAASQAGAPAKKDDASQKPDRARIEELIGRTRHGAEMFLGVQERVYALIQIATIQARTGDREAARRTFAEAERLAETVNIDDTTYGGHILLWVIRAEEHRGFRDEAIAASRKLLRLTEAPAKRETYKSHIYSLLIRTQAHMGDQEGVQETLRVGRRYFMTSKDPKIRDHAQEALLMLQADSGDLAGVLQALNDPELLKKTGPAKSRRYREGAVSGMLLLNDFKDIPAARSIVDEALKVVRDANGAGTLLHLQTRNDWLQRIALAQAQLGLLNEAAETAGRIDSETIPEDVAESRRAELREEERWKKTMALGEISLAQAKAGDAAGASRSAKEVARLVETFRDDRKAAIWPSAEAMARIGKVAEARQVADLLKAAHRRIDAYQVIATARRELGDEEGARATFEAAADLASRRLDEVKAGLRDSDSPERKTAHQMLEHLGRIRAKLGDRKGAMEAMRRINYSTRRNEALESLATDLALAGDLDGALEAVEAMNSPKSEADALRYIAGAFSRRKTTPPVR